MSSRVNELEFRGGWYKFETDNGVVSINNGVAKCTSDSQSSASIRIRKKVTGGDIITMSVFARSIGSTSHIFIDYPHPYGNVAPIIVEEDTEFKKYNLEYVIPHGDTESEVSFGLGNFKGDSGEAEFYAPIIKINGNISTEHNGGTYYIEDAHNQYITEIEGSSSSTNIYGNTSIGVGGVRMSCLTSGDMATVSGRFVVTDISESIPSDASFLIDFDLARLGRLNGWFQEIKEQGYGTALVDFQSVGVDAPPMAITASVNTNGALRLLAGETYVPTEMTVTGAICYFSITFKATM